MRIILKILSLSLLILMLGLPLVVQAQSEEECPLDDGTLTIAWIPKSLDNPVFQLGVVGAETRAAELTEMGPCAVEMYFAASLTTTPEAQIDVFDEVLLEPEIDAIGISCIEPVSCEDPINRAVEMGIPVMTWDSDSPESDRLTYLSIDNYEGGRSAAELLVRAMGESGTVAILSGLEGSFNLDERIRGFMDVIEEDYPDIEVLDILYSGEDPIIGTQMIEAAMEENPDIDGWFMVGLWPLFIADEMPTWQEATQAGELFTVTFDTLPFQLELVQEGYLHGLVGQKYWGWGYDTVTMLYDHILYDAEYEDFTDSGTDIVTSLNVDAMIEAWETNDFTQPLPDPFEEMDEESADEMDAEDSEEETDEDSDE